MGLFGNHARVGASAAGDYEIEKSLRFNDPDDAVLTRTNGTGTSNKKFTFSTWVKLCRGAEAAINYGELLNGHTADNDTEFGAIYFYSGALRFAGWSTNWRVTSRLFRDCSSWYHVIVAVDTTLASAGNRVKIYINGVEETAFATTNNPGQNDTFGISNNSAAMRIGMDNSASSSRTFDGYMAETHFIDGQQLTAASFGETHEDTGQWIPKKYEGTYGNNGFYLDFKDNSGTTATTLGKDSSGNGNNFTPNNFSVAAGVENDSLTDTPTNNWCTWNSLFRATDGDLIGTLSNGNLDYSNSGSSGNAGRMKLEGTMYFPSSGKWYMEQTVLNNRYIGIGSGTDIAAGYATKYILLMSGNDEFNDGSTSGAHATWSDSDVIGCGYDIDNQTVKFYKNGTLIQTYTGVTTSLEYRWFSVQNSSASAGTGKANFGQRPFHTLPAGYKALNTANLPTPTIKEGGSYFKAKLYTGNGSTQAITGLGFSPNLVTCKRRDGSGDNQGIFDTVRGATKELNTNASGAEGTCATCVTSFDADGFTLGNNGGMNGSGETYVAWNWKESASAGFDIVSYTGTGSATTVAHNLGVVPDVVIVKNRDVADGWQIQHVAKGPTFTQQMDGSGAFEDNDTVWNDTAPTSSTFAVGTDDKTNASGEKYIAYVWSGVDGYSKFGSYVGNGNTDGNFIYTGFKPAMIWIKNIGSSENWEIWDIARDPINVVKLRMATNTDGGDVSSTFFDLVSNGVKFRNTSGGYNSSGHTFVYLCFAERAFKYANAS